MKKYNMAKPYDKEVLDKLHNVHLEIIRDFQNVCEKHNLTAFALYGTAIGAVRHKGFIPWDDDIDMGMFREEYEKFLQIARTELKDKYQILTPEIDKNYACSVTHLQHKGTRFVPLFSKDLKCDMCIDLDIFVFDRIAPTKRLQKKQERYTEFYRKLLFLAGTPYPVIPLEGIAGTVAGAVCFVIHYILKLFHISPKWIYRKYKKHATMYDSTNMEYVTDFECDHAMKYKILKNDMFPMKTVAFENINVKVPQNINVMLSEMYGDYMKMPPKEQRINHAPYIIQFEGEEPIINE